MNERNYMHQFLRMQEKMGKIANLLQVNSSKHNSIPPDDMAEVVVELREICAVFATQYARGSNDPQILEPH